MWRGRLSLVDYGSGASASNVVYNYDEPSSAYGIGKLTSVNYGTGTKAYIYNIYDSLASESQLISSNTYTTEFDREVSGRLSRVKYPDVNLNSLEVFYSYSNNNQVASIEYIKNNSAPASLISSVLYNELNLITSITRANGVSESLNYNSADKSYHLDSLNVSNQSSSLLNFLYSYDSTSKIVGIDESVNSSSEVYYYDSLNRLEDYYLNSVKKRSYSYDSIGNIMSKEVDGVVKSYTYEQARSQVLTNFDGQVYNFDGFGNLSSLGQKLFSFDESDRLLGYTNASTSATYQYDHENMRTSKILNGIVSNEYIGKYAETKNGDPIYHIFLESQRVASFDSTGALNHLHKNHQDSTVLRTNEFGVEVFNQKYFPFGESRSGSSLLGDLNNFYTDQYHDGESDMYYYKNRYYLQDIGRFASADKFYLEEMNTRGVRPLEMNVYSYVGNDPVNMVDPSGNKAELGQHGAVININPFQHRAIVLRPDNPKDFQNHPLFKATGGQIATLGGQSSAAIKIEPGFTLDRPFGNLISAPNYPNDHPSNLKSLTEIGRPAGMSDTQFIKSLINASEMYKNEFEYNPFPSKDDNTYNSNSYTTGLIEQTGGIVPDMPLSSPGADKGIPLE